MIDSRLWFLEACRGLPRRKAKAGENLSVDDRDLDILMLLEQDARLPWRQLAKQLGVSEATIYLRVKKLRDKGVLKGFSARIDPERLGLRYRAFLLLKVRAPEYRAVRESLREYRYVLRVYEISGNFNMIAEVATPSHEDVVKIIDSLAEHGGIEEVQVISVLRTSWDAQSIIRDVLGWRGQARASGHG